MNNELIRENERLRLQIIDLQHEVEDLKNKKQELQEDNNACAVEIALLKEIVRNK